MPAGINIATRAWQVGQVQRTFDSPPAGSRGYVVTLGNRNNWPTGPCVRLTVELSHDNGVTWVPEQESTFDGAIPPRRGVPVTDAVLRGEWGGIVVDGVLVPVVPTAARITFTRLQAIEASVAAAWLS